MVIAIVVDLVDSKTNGSVMTAVRFAEGLKKRGHTVKVVAIGADGENDCPVKEKYFPLITEVSRLNQIKFGKFDKKKIRAAFEGVDIVHCIFPFNLEKKCKALADEMGIPSTSAFHVQPENVSYNVHLGRIKLVNNIIYRFFRSFYKKFNRIHCPSSFIANQLTQHGYKGELYVISNGYDPAFTPAPTPKVREGKFEIVMTGRLAPEKNQKVIVKAIALSRYRDDIHLTLFGNGARKKKLKKLASKNGVDVTFDFQPKEKLIERLRASDLYVHSATVEIEAIAALEAIACGLVPVIADSKLSATPQFALDERSLFTDDDEYSLAQKIDYWYEHDEERKIMGKLYAQSAQKYSLEKSLEMAERMFTDEIMEHKGKQRQAAVREN